MRRPYLALALVAPLLASVVMIQPGLCQLPPTNMGKYVHQPGDNQYSTQAQQERHGAPAPIMAPVVNNGGGGGGGGNGNGWVPAPHPFKPDISLEPIPADEPVVVAGFAPFPDRLDLPVSTGWGKGVSGGSYGGGGGGGGGAPSGGPPQPVGVHQHYIHYDPGAYVQDKGRGYYKAKDAPMPVNMHDQYAHNTTGGGPSMGGNGGGGGNVEPRLNPNNDKAMPAEAPAPVTIKQSVTQDLSLPDDDFSYQNPNKKPSAGSRFLKRTGRQLLQPVNNVGSMVGMGAGMGMSKVKF